jgi:hypothetical protein
MPNKKTIARARRDKRQGKAPSTQAGEFVREEMEHIRQGKHGARSAKQTIAIGLSEARRAGVKLSPPKRGSSSGRTRRSAATHAALSRQAHQQAAKRSASERSAIGRKAARTRAKHKR